MEKGPGVLKPQDASSPRDRESEAQQVETGLWSGRTHWKHFSGKIILWAVGSVAYVLVVQWVAKFTGLAGKPVWWIAGLPILATGGFFGAKLLVRITAQRYRLTQERLFIDRGLWTRTIDQMELIRVDDVRVRKTLIDRIFGLGSIEILSTDVSDRHVVLEGITGADEVSEMIRRQMRGLRKKSLFIENL